MKIAIIIPSTQKSEWEASRREFFERYASDDTKLELLFLEHGPAFIESEYDGALATMDCVEVALKAQRDGADAIILSLMTDDAIAPLREVLKIPVIATGHTTMALATTLANSFSLVYMDEGRGTQVFQRRWRLYGLEQYARSVRNVTFNHDNMLNDSDALVEKIVEKSIEAIREDGAHCIVLACSGWGGLAADISEGISSAGYAGVPVIDPTGVAMKTAEMLVTMGLSHSKLSYSFPRWHQSTGFENHGSLRKGDFPEK